MCNFGCVRWTITPRLSPRPWIACSSCGGPRPFQSCGKIRLNANGRKLDAWLIYRCIDCDRSWNRPLVERRNVGDIDPALLEALHLSDPYWVKRWEFDVDGLRRHAQRIDEFPDADIVKDGPGQAPAPKVITIELKVVLPTSLRLDRLLAVELGLSRTGIQALHEEGKLRIEPDRKDILRRRIADGTRVVLDRPKEARP